MTTFTLLSAKAFENLMAEVGRRLGSVQRTESRYQNLVQIAHIHQEMGNNLSTMIYTETTRGRGHKLACAAGCSTCCVIPSSARGAKATGNFTMSFLDIITLVENYAEIKSSTERLNEKATLSVAHARQSGEIVPCPHLRPSGACGIYLLRPVSCKIWFSADLDLCLRNRDASYSGGLINPLTNESKSICHDFEKPFEAAMRAIIPDIRFWDYDFLESFDEIARLDNLNLMDTLKEKIDASELSTWDPLRSNS